MSFAQSVRSTQIDDGIDILYFCRIYKPKYLDEPSLRKLEKDKPRPGGGGDSVAAVSSPTPENSNAEKPGGSRPRARSIWQRSKKDRVVAV